MIDRLGIYIYIYIQTISSEKCIVSMSRDVTVQSKKKNHSIPVLFNEHHPRSSIS